MTPEEINEMAQGGVPYTPQQNKEANERPKQEGGNGFKLYRKCPTCGAMQEVDGNPMIHSSQPIQQQFSHPMNPYIRPFPKDIQKRPPSGDINSEERADDGTPLVTARWNQTGTGNIPNTPIGGR